MNYPNKESFVYKEPRIYNIIDTTSNKVIIDVNKDYEKCI